MFRPFQWSKDDDDDDEVYGVHKLQNIARGRGC